MHFDIIYEYCMAKPHVTESFPFDNETMVWKIMGKMFCLANITNFTSLNLKCDPERAIELREQYPQITPGWHMNKKLWNTIELDGLSEKLVFELIDHSYDEVVRKLPKKVRDTLISL